MNIAAYGFPHAIHDRIEAAVQKNGDHQVTFIPVVDSRLPPTNGQVVFLYLTLGDDDPVGRVQAFRQAYPGKQFLLAIEHKDPNLVARLFRLGIEDLILVPVTTKKLDRVLAHLPSGSSPWMEGGKIAAKKLMDSVKRAHHRISAPPELGIIPLPDLSQPGTQPEQGLYVRFFGSLDLFGGKTARRFRLKSKKHQALLAYLLYYRGKKHHKDLLMAHFWPDSCPSSARNSLNVAFHGIRKSIRPILSHGEVILFEDDFYQWNPELTVDSDRDHFIQLWKIGHEQEKKHRFREAIEAYQQATPLYQGDLLEDLQEEDWFQAERENHLEIYLHMLHRQAQFLFQGGFFQDCLSICRRILRKDSCLEEIHRLKMASYLELGQREKAIRQYLRCKENLQNELQITPERKTTQLFNRILSPG